MLTVWTMLWGNKYSPYYVYRLKREVARRLGHQHRFICITDHFLPDIETRRPVVDWPGWWGKVSMFAPGFAAERNLWLDLDVVITGELDVFVEEYAACELAAPTNWAQSGHGGIQSSVMAWNGKLTAPFEMFDPAAAHWPPVNKPGVLWGDQEWLTRLRDTGVINVTHFDETLVRSYKYHCRGGVPDNCRVVVFHGKPDPHEVTEPWFQW